ncbi:MAG: sporulation protein YabP [Ruminococcus sp.]|nr:sporulation protein YabP [Ruminococcus sp.]
MSIGINDISKPKGKHEIVMCDCKTLSVTGVTDVDSFDEGSVRLFTECGEMQVYGENLHVNQMNVDTGSVSVEGDISAICYSDKDAKKRRSIIGRLLR